MSKSTNNSNRKENFTQDLLNYKNLLGEMGIQILKAIFRGANQMESIRMFSGVPTICITGRLPVLLSLKLISQTQVQIKSPGNRYYITEKGTYFLSLIT